MMKIGISKAIMAEEVPEEVGQPKRQFLSVYIPLEQKSQWK